MNDIYTELSFHPVTQEQSDTLVAMLSDVGYDGFEILKDRLNAYINNADFKETDLQEILNGFPEIRFTSKEIGEQNWNALWEASFEPVIVGDFVAVRAGFHDEQMHVKHDIIITPKMSFGTGHHATTALVIQLMESVDFTEKIVIDFGTGTGVLAILAEQLGASVITAIDNDKWSLENAKENFELNDAHKIVLKKAESLSDESSADIIIANINLNVLKANMDQFCKILSESGRILFSGLLVNDEEIFTKIIIDKGFVINDVANKDGWIAIDASFSGM